MGKISQEYLDFFSSDAGAFKYNVFKDALYGSDDALVSALFDRLVPFLPKKECLNVLDVGGGDGSRLKKIVSLLRERGFIVSATLVEPSKAFVRSLLLSPDFKRSKIKLRPLRFEDFLSEEKFDLIFFVHSVCAFWDKKHVSSISSLLAPGGKVVIVSDGDDSVLANARRVCGIEGLDEMAGISSVIFDLESAGFLSSVFNWDYNFSGLFDSGGFTSAGGSVLESVLFRDFSLISQKASLDALSVFVKNSKNGVVFGREVIVIAEKP